MTKRHMLVPIASFLLNVSTLEAQEWTEMSGRVSPYVTRLDGERLTCGLATQEEMASIREALDRMPRGLHPLGKYALAPPSGQYLRQLQRFHTRSQDCLSTGRGYLVGPADYGGSD